MTNAWRQTRRLKRLAVGPLVTPEYISWLGRRVNDNIPIPGQGDSQLVGKHVHMVPSELEIIKQDFERRNSELEKKIGQMEEEKMSLKLDVDVQKLETEGLKKEKRKAEEDLNSLKTDYKRLRMSMRTAGLGKTSEQWRQEVQEEKVKADRWEKRYQEAKKQNKSFERSLSESQSEKDELKARVAELEAMLQDYEARIEHLEANEDHQNEQLHYRQDQVASRDHIMGEAVVQIQGVVEHLQTLAVQADVLSVKYESESDQGQKLASILKEIKVLSFTPPHERVQAEYPRKSTVTIMPQQFRAGVSNLQTGSGFNPENNPVNPAIPDFDEVAEKERIKVELKAVRGSMQVARGEVQSDGSH
ncbi:uncharacterized protein LOC105762214 [Gossypium raimondii]|uniref:uncharacterized protein LOC105762214 n=1 Tax=Gossypium raimondii TaxID=29730 RepID=UPI00227BD0D5|nr:uncharacterized protein LOC105762214 [Gossypium raimondii]